MSRQKRHVGGRKEAPLAGAGSEGVGEQYKKTLTPSDAEYLRYSELLQIFFEKLIRWREIAQGEEYDEPLREDTAKRSRFDVVQTPTGLQLQPSQRSNPNKIISVYTENRDDPAFDYFLSEVIITPGKSGKQLLVDMVNTPIQEVKIEVRSQFANSPEDAPWSGRALTIQVTSPPNEPREHGGRNIYRGARYTLEKETLQVSHRYTFVGGGIMTDEYAVHLFNTLDALIPVSTNPTMKNERRVTPEIPTPKARPPARRARPQGR